MPASPPDTIQIVAAVLFGVALIHTFAAKQFERLSHRFPAHAGLFHLLGEVEGVFGFWALVRVSVMALLAGLADALTYLGSLIDGITGETVSADGLLLGALAALPWL